MPERSFRTPALILKRRDFHEADRLLTILTLEHGKLDVIAKGARKLTSHKVGHVELFTLTDMLIHSGRELGIVSQVELTEPYLAIREDLTRGAYASYVVELLDRFTPEGDAVPALFALLAETLARLCSDGDPRLVTRYFEMRLLDVVGFRPEVQQCVVGYEDIEPEEQFFSFELGGVVCPRHAGDVPRKLPVSLVGLKILRHMQRSGYDKVRALKINLAQHDEVERVLLGYITFLLERKLQSVDFIQRIRRG